MPLRNDDKLWIRGEIQDAIGTLRPRGWRRVVFTLRDLGPLAAVISIVIALLGITIGAIYYSVANVREETAFRTHTNDRLDRIEAAVKLFPAQIAAARYSGVPLQELQAHRDELKSIKNVLATADKSAPNFWPVSFEIITLLSRATSNPIVQGNESVLNNVVSNPPGLISEIANQRVVLINSVAGVTFRNSIVRFDPSVKLANDTFIDCVFVFPASMLNPPKPLQEIAEALLTSDISKATITAS